MERNDFVRAENLCLSGYFQAGDCYHVCSQENHPVVFHNEEEFKAAMNIVALAALFFPDVVVYTFEVMGNHLHFAMGGMREQILEFIHFLQLKLCAHSALTASSQDIRKLSFKVFKIENLDNMRNVIAYINRNGSVVSSNYSPFSYPWGSNRYFFNPEAVVRYSTCGKEATYAQKRELFRSNLLAKTENIILLDGYVSPLCYCHIEAAEGFFRSCRHYFQCISRNVEAAKDIAKSIGENIFYHDDELYSILASICSKKYGTVSVAELPSTQKTEIAKILHYDYNASNKQISRLLKIGIDVVNLLFPRAL